MNIRKSHNRIDRFHCALQWGTGMVLLFITLLINLSNKSFANTDSTIRVYYEHALELEKDFKYDSSIKILEKAIVYIDSTDNYELITDIYSQIASMSLKCNMYDKATYYHNQNIYLKKEQGQKDLSVDYIGLSLVFLERGFADSALLYIDSSKYYKELANDSLVSTSLENNTGRIYMDRGDFDIALKHFYLALESAQKNKDTINLIYIHLNMGTLYQMMKKYDNALDSYLKSLELSKITNNLEGIAYAYSIGIIYRRRGEYEKAMDYYTQAISPCQKLDKLADLSNIYSNMSNVYNLTGRHEEAAKVLLKSINVSYDAGNHRQLGIAYANMGKTKELTGQYDSAIYYLGKSMKIFEKLGSRNLRSSVLQMMSDALKGKKDFENALVYYKKHIELSDSIFNEKVEKQIAELRTKYETEKKEKENKLLKKDIEIEKRKSYSLLIFAIILILTSLVCLALFYFIRKNAINKKKLAEMEAVRLEEQLETQKRELTLGALSLSRNMEFINSLINELKNLSDHVSEEGLSTLNNIVKKLAKQQSDSSWKDFETRFSDIHSEFYSMLFKKYPNLTQNEVKLSAFMKLGMNTKEICSITFQSIRAVEAARLRLRKKLNLSNSENLSIFLQKF